VQGKREKAEPITFGLAEAALEGFVVPGEGVKVSSGWSHFVWDWVLVFEGARESVEGGLRRFDFKRLWCKMRKGAVCSLPPMKDQIG
jgi:hypothetical protein